MAKRRISDLRKNGQFKIGEETTLSTGVKVKLSYVPVMLTEEAQRLIETPQVPVQQLEDGREIENFDHPDYLNAVQEANRKRIDAAFDTIIMFGFEPVGGLPEDDGWLKKLRWLEKRGHLDFDGFDLEDELDRQFIYLKYFAIGEPDMAILSQLAGLSQEDITQAEESFRGDETRNVNSKLPAAA